MSAFKRAAVMIVVALVGALLISLNSNNKLTYEDRLIQAGLKEALGPEAIELLHESSELQALFLDYSEKRELVLKARMAIDKYGDVARKILVIYGAEEEFKEILTKYGENVIPVIQYFVTNDPFSVRMSQTAIIKVQNIIEAARRKMAAFVKGQSIAPPVSYKISFEPNDQGWYAVMNISSGGHNFLSQFETAPKNEVVWIQSKRLTDAIESFFLSGVRNFETKYALDQEIKTEDLLWVIVDTAVVVSSLKVLRVVKMARAGKAVKVAGTMEKEISLLNRTKLLAGRLIPKGVFGRAILKYGTVVGGIYVAVKHPGILNSIFAEAAQLFGLNPQLVQVTCWAILIYAICMPLSPILRILLPAFIQALSMLSASISQLNRLFALNKPAGEIHE